MADIVLQEKTPLGGAEFHENGCSLREVTDIALTSLAVPLGGDDAFAEELGSRFELDRPGSKISTAKGARRAVSLTADQIMLMHPISEVLTDLSWAYATDQTSNWCILELSGAASEEVLRRVCPLDLHEAQFPVNASARTIMEHMGALVIKAEPDSFLLLSSASSALSFAQSIHMSMVNST